MSYLLCFIYKEKEEMGEGDTCNESQRMIQEQTVLERLESKFGCQVIRGAEITNPQHYV